MEFEEMRKIWDKQNKQPLYVIDEQAMHKNIKAKRKRSTMIANINEIGLIIIGVVVSVYLIFKSANSSNTYAFLPALGLVFTGVYVFMQRRKRKHTDNQFDRSILGDLNQAIANADYQLNFAKTFVWWYIMPVAIPLFINMLLNDVPLWKWIFVPASMILSYLVVNYELRKCHIPQKRKLELLKEKLVQDVKL